MENPNKEILTVSSCLIIKGMYLIRRKYSTPSHVGLVPFPQYFLETDDSLQEWYMIHKEAL